MREAYKRFKVASTGGWAVSVRTYILTVPFALVMNVERENLLNPGDVSRSIAICMVGELVSWLYLFIAQATLLKHRRVRQQRLSTCIFVWFSAGAVKSLGFITYSVWVFELEPDLAVRTVLPALFTGVSSAILAFYFGTIDRKRIENTALTAVEGYLFDDRDRLLEEGEGARLEAIGSLKQNFEHEIKTLREIVFNLKNEVSEIKDKDKLRKILRLTSEMLARISSESENLAGRAIGKRTPDQSADRRPIGFGLEPKVISVRISAIAITLGMLTGQLTRNGVNGVQSGLLGTALLVLTLFLLRRLSRRFTGLKLRFIIAASYPLVFIVQAFYVNSISPLFFDLSNPYMPWYSAMKTIYGYYIASMIASLLIDQTKQLSQSLATHSQLVSELRELNHEQRLLRAHVAAIRYGTIKGKIAGVSMALQLVASESTKNATISSQNELLTDAINLLNEANEEIMKMDLGQRDG